MEIISWKYTISNEQILEEENNTRSFLVLQYAAFSCQPGGEWLDVDMQTRAGKRSLWVWELRHSESVSVSVQLKK